MPGEPPFRPLRLPLWAACAVSLACTGLLAVGAPPQGIPAVIWVAYVPALLVCRTPEVSPRRAAFVGWFGGLGAGLFGFPWIAELLTRFAGFSWPLAVVGLVVFSMFTAVPWGIFGYLVRRVPLHGAAGAAWAAAAWVAAAATWPALFPFTSVLGLAQAPVWIQLAELGGTALVEAQILVVSSLLTDALLAHRRRDRFLHLGAAVAVFAAVTGIGALRMAAVDRETAAARKVRFGVVQPNIPIKWYDTREKIGRLRRMSAEAQAAGAQVVLWPEAGVYPIILPRNFARDFVDPRRRILLEHRLPTIFGAPTFQPGDPYGWNTVFNLRADGTVDGRFDKVKLMPFGEYVPWVDPKWAKSKLETLNHNHRGTGPARFRVDPAPARDRPVPGGPFYVGPLVCYEDIFADFARRTAALPGGISAFVNLTIDTWFGDTAEPWEHLALAQFRSVEHRIPMVRAVAAGPSSVVDAAGRVTAHLPVHGPTPTSIPPPQVLVADVAVARDTAAAPTPYARGGFVLPHLCQVGVVAVLLAGLRRRRRRPAAG